MKFTKETRVPSGPNVGVLYAAESSYDGLYFRNGDFRKVRCGVEIDVPEGFSVDIQGLYPNEAKNLHVVPRSIHGPFKGPVDVIIWNNAPSTLKLDPYCPIAQIRAYKSPAPVPWKDVTPEPPLAVPVTDTVAKSPNQQEALLHALNPDAKIA